MRWQAGHDERLTFWKSELWSVQMESTTYKTLNFKLFCTNKDKQAFYAILPLNWYRKPLKINCHELGVPGLDSHVNVRKFGGPDTSGPYPALGSEAAHPWTKCLNKKPLVPRGEGVLPGYRGDQGHFRARGAMNIWCDGSRYHCRLNITSYNMYTDFENESWFVSTHITVVKHETGCNVVGLRRVRKSV